MKALAVVVSSVNRTRLTNRTRLKLTKLARLHCARPRSLATATLAKHPPRLRRWVRVSVANSCWVAHAGVGRADDGGGGRESGRGRLRWGAGVVGHTMAAVGRGALGGGLLAPFWRSREVPVGRGTHAARLCALALVGGCRHRP